MGEDSTLDQLRACDWTSQHAWIRLETRLDYLRRGKRLSTAPVDAAWAEALQSECQEFNCAFFMKQMSAFTPTQGKALIPAYLLIHEFPGARIE